MAAEHPKLSNYCTDKGKRIVVPQTYKLSGLGSVVATGSTMAKAIKNVQELAGGLTGTRQAKTFIRDTLLLRARGCERLWHLSTLSEPQNTPPQPPWRERRRYDPLFGTKKPLSDCSKRGFLGSNWVAATIGLEPMTR